MRILQDRFEIPVRLMRFLLFTSLLPTALYLMVYMFSRFKAHLRGEPIPAINSASLINSFVMSLILAIVLFIFIFYGSSHENSHNDYQSPAKRLMKEHKIGS